MIIIGYQGIGKSTTVNEQKKSCILEFIDLESGNFFRNVEYSDYRHSDWYIYYCNIAESLSRQGYKVFVSSHEEVRQQLKKSSERVIVVCPAQSLKREWIAKLENRYKTTKTMKDYKAWKNAESRYTENIYSLTHSGYDVGLIRSMDYDLISLVDSMR